MYSEKLENQFWLKKQSYVTGFFIEQFFLLIR